MKYHDSIKKADQLMAQSVKQLRLWHLASTPINYAVSYEYVSGKNKPLISAIKFQLSSGKKLDNFYIEEVHQQFILGQSLLRDELLTDVNELINDVKDGCVNAQSASDEFIHAIDSNINGLRSANSEKIAESINSIHSASKKFKINQQQLVEKYQSCEQLSVDLHEELEQAQNDIYLDALTGLYNRKAMSKHIETWYKSDPDKQIAAIVINVDQFSEVTQRFGSLIGDVLLTKIAKKVSSYVDDSGLPVRSSGDEFLILLPDVERNIASEIAEKIREGVEKLRFISSKSGVRLPKMTISVGVNEFKVSENVNKVVGQTREIIGQVKNRISPQTVQV